MKKPLLLIAFAVIGAFCVILLFNFALDDAKKDRVVEIKYVDHVLGNKVTSQNGNVLYFTTDELCSQQITKGAGWLNFSERKTKNDTIDAKVLYYEWRAYSGEVPSYYDGEWRGVCVTDDTNLSKTLEFASKVEPTVGKRYTFISFVELGGEKGHWILQNQ